MEEKEECSICLDEVETIWRKLGCQHRYHKKCIEEWMRVSERCPLCMKNIRRSEMEEMNRIRVNEMYCSAIRRYVIFICCILVVIIVVVLCSP